MSDIEANKQVVRDIARYFNEHEFDKLRNLCTEDMYWVQPNMEKTQSKLLEGIGLTYLKWTRDEMIQTFRNTIESVEGGDFKITILFMTAEENRVAWEAVSHAACKVNGRHYDQHYHHLMIFRDGKVCEWREYQDTAHCVDVWIAP